jgi:tetratricopeptide (TPR) repeat protein
MKPILLIFASLLLTAVGYGQFNKSEREMALNRLLEQPTAKNLDAANEILMEILEKNPNNLQAVFLRGIVLEKRANLMIPLQYKFEGRQKIRLYEEALDLFEYLYSLLQPCDMHTGPFDFPSICAGDEMKLRSRILGTEGELARVKKEYAKLKGK